MKVYVITSGEYSAYGIRAVALSREKRIYERTWSSSDSTMFPC